MGTNSTSYNLSVSSVLYCIYLLAKEIMGMPNWGCFSGVPHLVSIVKRGCVYSACADWLKPQQFAIGKGCPGVKFSDYSQIARVRTFRVRPTLFKGHHVPRG